MALTWDVTDIEDHENVTTLIPTHDDPNGRYKAGARLWHPTTEALVMVSMSTGINHITEKNASEVYARINLLERVNGPQLIRAVREDGTRPQGMEAFITPEEVHAHIGLRTNASPKTRAAFMKIFDYDMRGAIKRYNRAFEKEKVA